MIQRLIDFYTRTKAGEQAAMGPVWQGISVYHVGLRDALNGRDCNKTLSALNGIGQTWLLYGIDNAHPIAWGTEMANAQLKSLATRIGLLPRPNPEQPCPDVVLAPSILRQDVETSLGVSLTPPPCFGLTDGTNTLWKMFIYAGIFWGHRKQASENVLEIGAGFGTLGFFLWSLKAKSYTIIDLPFVSVLSAWFLSKVCGESNVWLEGEPENAGAFAKLFSTSFAGARRTPYQLVVNNDSFPEITNNHQDEYLDLIAETLAPDGRFVSVNHESNCGGQRRVFEAIRKHGKLRLLSRAPYMLREGYVEEVYVRNP